MSNIISVYKIYMSNMNRMCDDLLKDLPGVSIGTICCSNKEYNVDKMRKKIEKIKEMVNNEV